MHSLQRGTKSQLKKQSHLKSPVKLKVSPKIKFPVHSHLEYIMGYFRSVWASIY